MNNSHSRPEFLQSLSLVGIAGSYLTRLALGTLILWPFSLDAAAPGELDPEFGSNGLVLTDFGADDWIAETAIQADGKIVAAGASGDDAALARYNPDGSLDTSFGVDGKVTTDFGGSGDYFRAVKIQPDGKIVAGGRFFPRSFADDFALARYNPDGSLDSGFGVNGVVITDLGAADLIGGVVIQPDGKIIAGGTTLPGSWDAALARYNADGSLDASFGVGGVVTTDFGSSDSGGSVLLQPDGKIVTAGLNGAFPPNGDFAVARYNPDGTLDTSFGVNGKVTTDLGAFDAPRGIARQSDGKIVVAGYTEVPDDHDIALVRYNTDGSLDTSFGVGGSVITELGGREWAQGGVVIQASDGKITVAGPSTAAGTQDFAVLRYNPDGSLDASFGVNGVILTDFGGSEVANAISIQPSDGKYVVAGVSDVGGNQDFALARYFYLDAIPVAIDIKSGSARNPINLRAKKGTIPVAVLTTDTFDALQLDWETVRFGPAGATEIHERLHITDTDGDGDMDAKLHFRTRDTGIRCSDTEATLTGETFAGDAFTGTDAIKIVKCPKRKRR